MIKDAEALPCGHSFHKKCVADWENQTQRLSCAVCKHTVKYAVAFFFVNLTPICVGRQDYVTVKNMKIPFDAEDFHIHGGIIDRGYVLGTIAFKRHVCSRNICRRANYNVFFHFTVATGV